MATQTTVTISCDICGSTKGTSSHRIALDGQAMEIDLCSKDSKALDKVAQKYVPFARKAKRSIAAASRRTTRDRHHSAAVREWAREQGMQLSDRGRIPAEVESQYAAAH